MSTQFAPLQQMLQTAQHQQHYCLRAADAMDACDLHVLAHALRYTARQEAEHSAVLRAVAHAPLPMAHPSPLPESPVDILQAAITHEEAACALLPDAIRQAQADGNPRAAQTLAHIARTEADHARRFRRCLHSLQKGSLLHHDRRISWFCLGCGALHLGSDAPESCEGCGCSRGHFIRSDFSPIACP